MSESAGSDVSKEAASFCAMDAPGRVPEHGEPEAPPVDGARDPRAPCVFIVAGPRILYDGFRPGRVRLRLSSRGSFDNDAGGRHDLPNRIAQDPVDEAPIRMQRGVRQIDMADRKPRKPGEHAPQAKFRFYDWPDPILPLKDLDPGAR